ncbi:MAG: glycosyltransferase family 2 protein [Bryobacterales bacterium]|nr:glycosyltransferase family 2 protein [Bryobacterales bacterium]
MAHSVSVIIATRNRPAFLKETLTDIARQNCRPDEVIVVDASEQLDTKTVVETSGSAVPVRYIHSTIPSAARQRNVGAAYAHGDLLMFLDDDVSLDGGFIKHVVSVFDADHEGKVGGVTGTIANESFQEMSWFNTALLRLCLGVSRHEEFAGRVLGPAVNFSPRDLGDQGNQTVEWMAGVCATYRRNLFLEERFPEHYRGYSFAEDLHLSLRIARRARLVCSGGARLIHRDGGKGQARDWVALGNSIVRHRYEIMTSLLGKRSMGMKLRLLFYEGVYHALVVVREAWRTRDGNLLKLQLGRMEGLARVLSPGYKVGMSE